MFTAAGEQLVLRAMAEAAFEALGEVAALCEGDPYGLLLKGEVRAVLEREGRSPELAPFHRLRAAYGLREAQTVRRVTAAWRLMDARRRGR